MLTADHFKPKNQVVRRYVLDSCDKVVAVEIYWQAFATNLPTHLGDRRLPLLDVNCRICSDEELVDTVAQLGREAIGKVDLV